jgi:uncharacterized protein (TIGR01370 family)
LNRKHKLENATNYALYYGVGREAELTCFDIVIVEPAGQSQESIKSMQETGSLVLAYLSFMEIAEYAEEFKLLERTDFLKDKDRFLRNEEFDTYVIDIRSLNWQQLLLQKVNTLFLLGYDGLFIDTIGDIENSSINSATREMLIDAAVNILKEIRQRYSERILIQNNGLEQLCSSTASIIDGLCWENPPFNKKECFAWIERITNHILMLKSLFKIKIFILLEENTEVDMVREEEKAKDLGLLFYEAVKGYVDGVKKPL